MIGDDEGGGAFVNGAAGIVTGEDAFDEDGAGPDFAEPAAATLYLQFTETL